MSSATQDLEVRGALVGASEIQIDAGADVVWDVLTAIDRWPSWNPLVAGATLEGDLRGESTFRWKAGPGTIVSTIKWVEPTSGIAWTGRTMGIRAFHVWRLEPRDGGTFVRTEESYDGLVARLFRHRLQHALDDGLEQGLVHLKAEAERRKVGGHHG
jgi:uncharacterized protein YndB with AHSA1/START domain